MKINQTSSCKIYSRKRFSFFSSRNTRDSGYYGSNNRKSRKILLIIGFILILYIGYYIIMNSINPIFETLCRDKAREIATNITNEEATNIMSKYEYEELFNIERDSNGDIQLISANIITINKIISDIAIRIQKSLYNENEENLIKIATGSITGLKMFSGMGPYIDLEISSVGNVKTDLKSVFEEKSINQTMHKIYLEIDCEVSILTPFNTIKENIINQVLLAENVIVGKIPESYYNLHGFEEGNELLEVME